MRDCVISILDQQGMCEVIILDNGNTHSERDYLDRLETDTPGVRVIRPDKNLGFAGGCNLAAMGAKGEFIALINPDLVVPQGAFSQILEIFAASPQAWLCGGRVLNMDGSEQRGGRREILTPWRSLVEVLRLDRLFPGHPHFRRWNLHESVPVHETAEVPVVSGAFMVIPRERWRALGGMDSSMFLHIEDIDLCLRILKSGGKVLYCGSVPVYHHKGTSDATSLFIEWHKARSTCLYFHKHFTDTYPRWALRGISALLWMRFALLSVRALPQDIRRIIARKRHTPDLQG